MQYMSEFKYKHILFDLDETLLDFHLSETIAFKKALAEAGIPYSEDLRQFYSAYNQSLWKKLERKETTKPELLVERFRAVIERTGVSFDPIELNSLYTSFLSQSGIFLPGAEAFLTSLVSGDHPHLYIITNGNKMTVKGRVADSGMMRFVEDVFVSDTIGANKPSPVFFNYVIDKIGCSDLSSYLVVGDSLTSDIQGAINAGMPCVLFSASGNFPSEHSNYAIDYRVSDYSSLFNIVTTTVN